jgi:RNA polymerase sigma-70 factor, ECF subfamily
MHSRKKLSAEAPHCMDDLYNFAIIMTGSRKKAENVLTRIISEAAGYYPYHQPEDIRKWLFRIALNIFNVSQGYVHNTGSETELPPPPADRITIEEFFKSLDEKKLLSLLSEIPLDLRLILVLKEALNFSYDNISELADIPIGSVIMRLNRARNLLYIKAAGK